MTGKVPEFKSFPPSFQSFPDLDEPPASAKDDRKGSKVKDARRREKSSQHDDESSSRKHSDKSIKPSRKHRDGEKEPSRHKREKDSEKLRLSAAEEFIEEALGIEKLKKGAEQHAASAKGVTFIEDRRGDDENLRYGSSNPRSVPRYHLFGRGNVLGFSVGWKLVRGSEGEITLRGNKQNQRYMTSRTASRILSQPRRLIPPSETLAGIENAVGEMFIAVSGRRRNADITEDPSWKSIDPSLRDSDASSSDSDGGSVEADDENTMPTDPAAETTASLTAAVKAYPASALAWLQLIDHSAANSVTSEARSDVALSILERAFSADERNKSNPTLWVRYLGFGSTLWSPSRLDEEWSRALRQTGSLSSTDRAGLFIDYLTHRLKFGGVAGLEAAVSEIWGFTARDRPSSDLDLFKLRVLWRACVAIMEAGYSERAIAIFQAQIELSLFGPASLHQAPLSEKLNSLEVFWESECPRIGDPGAQGWATWSSNPKGTEIPTRHLVADVINVDNGKDTLGMWFLQEMNRTKASLGPLRTVDEDDDPYTTVLFSDIRPYLFDISAPTSSPLSSDDFSVLLACAFIQLLGLHFPGLSARLDLGTATGPSWDSTWSDTRFGNFADLRSCLLCRQAHKTPRDWEVISGTVVARELTVGESWGPVKEWSWNVLSPLEGYGLKGEGRSWEQNEIAALPANIVDFIGRVFEQISAHLKSVLIDQYWLSFVATTDLKRAHKISRTLLSEHRDSLPRWLAHARAERMRGRNTEARKVYEVSLQNYTISSGTPGVCKMFWDWAEMEWSSGDSAAAKAVIAQSCGLLQGGTGSSADLLRLRRFLDGVIQERKQAIVSAPDPPEEIRSMVALISLSALLELLLGSDITTALARYSVTIGDNIPSRWTRCLQESLAVASNLLLYHHTKTLRAPLPPQILRNLAIESVSRFSGNSVLLGMWLESERGESIWGRVRQTIARLLLQPGTAGINVDAAFWTVWQELRRNVNWEVERVRTILKRTLKGERSGGSLSAWLVAIDLELGLRETKRAKALLYQALSECPWAKELYLLPFTEPLRSEFAKIEIRQWAETMAERQIRLRVPIEKYLEDALLEDEESIAEDDEGDQELEELVDERRRLMPF